MRPGLHGRLHPCCGFGTLVPQVPGKLRPSPHAAPRRCPASLPRPVRAHAGYLRSGRRTLPPPETWRLRGPGRAPALHGPRLSPARPRRLPRSSRASLTQRSDTPKPAHQTRPSPQGYRQAGPRLPASLTARASTSGCSAPRAPDPREPWKISFCTVPALCNFIATYQDGNKLKEVQVPGLVLLRTRNSEFPQFHHLQDLRSLDR